MVNNTLNLDNGSETLLKEALARYQNALAIFSAASGIGGNPSGDYDRSIGAVLRNIGTVYYHQKNYQEALIHYQKSIAKFIVAPGNNDQDIVDVLRRISRTLRDIRDTYGAAYSYSHRLNHYQQLGSLITYPDSNNREIPVFLRDMGISYTLQDNYGKALEYYEHSIARFIALPGNNNEDIAMILRDMGMVYVFQDNYQEALKHYQQSIVRFVASPGDNNHNIESVNNYINDLKDLMNKRKKQPLLFSFFTGIKQRVEANRVVSKPDMNLR